MKKRFTIFLFSFLFITILAKPGKIYAQVWEPVGNPGGISEGSAGRNKLLFDKNDNLYVGYYDVAAGKGSVQQFDYASSSWYYLGGEPGITGGTATYNSLSVDHNGVLYFLNQAGWPETGHEVRSFQDASWDRLPNVTDAMINFNTSAVSPDGVLFAANNENNGTVKRLVNGAWERVGPTGFAGGVPFYLDMAIGSNGKVYISFNNGGLKIFENNLDASETDPWEPVGGISPIAPAAQTEEYNSSIAIDSENNLYVAYVSSSAEGFKLNVKKYNGEEWITLGSPNFTENRVKHVSIAIAADDIIYVAVSNWEDENLLRNYVLAFDEENNSWYQAGTGFASEAQGIFNSLAVDSFGNLFLAFTDSGLGKLSVKKLNLFLVAAETIEITPEDGVEAIIDVDDGSLQLVATVFPLQASQEVVWSIVSGETFATITDDGLLTAIASNAVVTVKAASAENSSIFGTIDVVLTNQISDIEANRIIISPEGGGYPDIFAIGNTLKLIPTVIPPEADQFVTWTIEEGSDIISIDSNGLITAISEGFVTVRATHIHGMIYEEIRVNVWENGCTQGTPIDYFGLGYYITAGSDFKSVDDFIVEEGVRFEVSKLRLRLGILGLKNSGDDFSEITIDTLEFLEDDNGRPGRKVVASVSNLIPVSQTPIFESYTGVRYDVEIELPEPLAFNQGTYWINPRASAQNGKAVFWESCFYTLGGSHCSMTSPHGFIPSGFDMSFEISGNCIPMPVIISIANDQEPTIFTDEVIQLQAEVNYDGLPDVIWTIEAGSEHISMVDGFIPIITGLSPGKAVVRATLENNSDYYDEIEITVLDPNICEQEVLSNNLQNAYLFGGIRLAVDIPVEEGIQFIIQNVIPSTAGYATYFKFVFSKDELGFPGEVIDTINGSIVHDWFTGTNFDQYFHRYTVELDYPIALNPGNYWMEIKCDALAWESTSVDYIGFPGVFDQGAGWVYASNKTEYVYGINGVCEPILPENIIISTVNNESTDILIDEVLQLKATVFPEFANQNVVWGIETGSEFVSIDQTGLVTGKAKGVSVIKATSVVDPEIYGTIEVVVVGGVGINIPNSTEVSYYPIPVKDFLSLNSEKPVDRIEIYNLTGQQLGSQSVGDNHGIINMNSYPSGLYIVKVIFIDGNIETLKILKN